MLWNAPALARAFSFCKEKALTQSSQRSRRRVARPGKRALHGVCRPAKNLQFGQDSRERKADYVEIAAFDAGDVAPRLALDSVCTRFIIGLLRGEIRRKFFVCDRPEVNQRGLDELAPFAVG